MRTFTALSIIGIILSLTQGVSADERQQRRFTRSQVISYHLRSCGLAPSVDEDAFVVNFPAGTHSQVVGTCAAQIGALLTKSDLINVVVGNTARALGALVDNDRHMRVIESFNNAVVRSMDTESRVRWTEPEYGWDCSIITYQGQVGILCRR